MSSQSLRTAIILAAGNGSKLWPYNIVRQKATFPIANVPIVRRLADSLVEAGIHQLVVVVGVHERSVRAALHGTVAEVRYVRQDSATGSADAVLHGAHGIDEDFLVLAGDVVTDNANIAAIVDRFHRERSHGVALVQRLGQERPQDWIVAEVDGDRLTGVVGHPRSGDYRLGGVYAFRTQMLPYLLNSAGVMQNVPVGGMPPAEAEIGQSLQMAIDDGRQLAAVEVTGHHVDVDKPWHILEANERVLDDQSAALAEDAIHPSARVHDGAEINGRVVLGPNAVIGNRVVVRGDLWLEEGAVVDNGAIFEGHAVIGAQTKVRDYCLIGGRSSLGPHGIYGHGAEFTGVALDRVHCYHYCEIWGVAGSAVDFGAATVCGNLRFDDGETRWRIHGRSEFPASASNAAYFGDYSRTGVNATIMPGKRTGAYSVVGAGVVLYEDLPDREMVTVRQELVRRTWGPDQYGW